MIRLGIIKEHKVPPDTRTPLTPAQCRRLMQDYPDISIMVAPSPHRCFGDSEYIAAGVKVQEDLTACDILMGVKEVPVDRLIPHKTYFFFSHTIKKQSYNRGLLQQILKKNIRLIDWETLTNAEGHRLIAFGRWAGIVGAHNGLMAFGSRTGKYKMGRVYKMKDYVSLQHSYLGWRLPAMRIVLTGAGRVATGAREVLDLLQIKQVNPQDYLHKTFKKPIYVQLDSEDLYCRIKDGRFDRQEFFRYPARYRSLFDPFPPHTDIMMNAIYWDPAAPLFFKAGQLCDPDFRISTIADITCDIKGSVPITLRASTIPAPVYGIDRSTLQETKPYQPGAIDIMAVDNLPNELPRDASEDFGKMVMTHVIGELFKPNSRMLTRATITAQGALMPNFKYLENFVDNVSE